MSVVILREAKNLLFIGQILRRHLRMTETRLRSNTFLSELKE